MTRSVPPAHDEVEVSIFGPGRGEGVLLHLGAGDWITVDSCIERRPKQGSTHPVLNYLDEIGVDAASAIRCVVATHAHDDHTAGIGELYRRSADAQFVKSAAFTSTEFYAAVEADESIRRRLRQSVRREFAAVEEEALRRGRFADGRAPIRQAHAQRVLWSRSATAAAPAAAVIALSPSDFSVHRAQTLVASGSARVGDRQRLSAGDPNEYSVALWVEVGDARILLGADLTTGPRGSGWLAVVEEFAPEQRADLYKVAHHGSPNADLGEGWETLLEPAPVGLLSPFRAGRIVRPTSSDIARLSTQTGALYSSARPAPPAPSNAVVETRRALRGVVTSIREPDGAVGQARARRLPDHSTWSVDLFPPARKLA